MARRLNFGCGADVRPGWTNFDVVPAPGVITPVDGVMDFDDNAFSLVVANHSLCAIEWIQLEHWLREIHRVLRVGGVLRVLVPDIVAAFNAWSCGHIDWFPHHEHHPDASIDWLLSTYLTWYSENRSVFTGRALLQQLEWAGFKASLGVARSSHHPSGTELDTRSSESLIVEGVKRGA